MQLEGTVQDGLVVLDDKDAIPNGTRVEITPIPTPGLAQRLNWFVGSVPELPADFAAEHDHYIHGTSKRNVEGPS